MFTPRLTKEGMKDNPYWYSSEYNFSGESLKLPNCTCYCLGRSSEIAGRNVKREMFPDLIPNATNWYSMCKWEHGSVPKLGAIAVWSGTVGHVAIVEKINKSGTITVSQSNYEEKKNYNSANYFQTRTYNMTVGKKTQGVGLIFKGYIYNPYVEDDMGLVKFEKDPEYEYKWSVDGNPFGDKYDITTQKGFADTDLETSFYERILKVNGSLFYTYEGKHYACGLEKSRGVNNQPVGMTAVSDYNNCMAVACVNDELVFGSQKWIINNVLDSCYGAITGMGLILSGSLRSDMHKGFETQWNQISGRTVIGEDKDGNFMSYSFAGETGKSGLTGPQLQDKCLELGFYNAICLDGGGSVFREVRGSFDISSSRKVKNALMLYRRKKSESNDSSSTQYLELQNMYNELKMSYNMLLDTNEDLKADISRLKAQLSDTQGLLSDKENALNIALKKLQAIKELIE